MTAPTKAPSAYPRAIEDLMPDALTLVRDSGGLLPSQRQLKDHLHIGSDKAKAVLAALVEVAAKDRFAKDVHTYQVTRGSLADPPIGLLDPVTEPTEPAVPAPVLDDNEMPPPPEVSPLLSPVASAVPEITDQAVPAATDLAPAAPVKHKRPVTWPVLLLCLPAFVAIWGGWVEMGRLTGFGEVALLPGIADQVVLDTAITLPIGVETYAAYALWVWLSGRVAGDARRFARASAIGSLAIGALGQVAYHLMSSWGWESAPWPITAVVACIPVAVLGMGAALAHLMHHDD